MSIKANKSVVGLFVVCALALLVIGIVIFGGGKFFSKKRYYVMRFEGSMKGLQIGAPVTFRGVKIGAVEDVEVVIEEGTKIDIPVVVSIDPGRMHYASARLRERMVGLPPDEALQRLQSLVDEGLRATLQQQSFVTGMLQVALDFFPNAEPATLELEGERIRFPTVQSGFSKLAAQLEEVPLGEMFNQLMRAVQGVADAVNSPETKAAIANLDRTSGELAELARTLNDRSDPMLTSLGDGLEEVRALVSRIDESIGPLVSNADGTMGDLRTLLRSANDKIGPIADGVKETTDAATRTLEEAAATLAAARGLVPENSALAYQLSTTMEALTGALDAVKDLASYLERHPEALLHGK